MEALRQDDPRRLGPYTLVGRLDADTSEIRAASRRFVGVAPGGERTVLISTVPLEAVEDPGHARRFHTEALAAQRAGQDGTPRGPWLLPVGEVSGPAGGPVWYASPYRPALPLPAAVEAHGPLRTRTLLAVGTALGEALARLHADGTAHAGVRADAVLLTGEGPRLTGYGAARVTAPDGTPRPPHPFLAPEQIAGGRPRPLGDIYGLGAVLAYAATGQPQSAAPHPAERAAPTGPLEGQLGELLASCLAEDPSARPTAADFLAALETCGPPLPGYVPSAPRVPPPPPRAQSPASISASIPSPPKTSPAVPPTGPPTTPPTAPPATPPTTPPAASATVPPPTPPSGPLPPSEPLPPSGPPSIGPVATLWDGGPAAPSGPSDPQGGAMTGGTVLDGAGGGRAASMIVPGWLPRRVSASLAAQAAAVLAAEADEEAAPAAEPAPEPTALDGAAAPVSGPAPSAPLPAPSARARGRRLPTPSRRSLLTAVGTGVAGAAVGGSVAWAVTSDSAPEPTPAEKLAARRKTRKRLKGAPPTPAWRYDLADPVRDFAPLLYKDEVAVLADGKAAVGVAVRTGDELWRRAEAEPSGRAWPLSNGLVLLAGSDLLALGARDGKTRWHSERYRKGGRRPYTAVLAAHGHVVWLVVESARSSSTSRTVVAYDITDDRELWSNPLPAGYRESHLLADTLVVVTAKKGEPPRLTAYDRETGRERWTRTYEPAASAHLTTVADPATLVAAKGASLRAYGLGEKGKERWKVTAEDKNEQKPDFLGVPVSHKHSVYVSDSTYATHCVDARTGNLAWRTEATFDLEPTTRNATPDTAVTPDGRVLLSANDVEVDAFETRTGSLLWRFTDRPSASGTVLRRRKVALNDEYALVVSGRGVYALPLG
ncbi:outer membrane protein assembly factor BamB family protein [Streptomyces reniochalinae]|uniref:Protein kinase domain-containing protein n=1 Tax=Streptomyces reniochalinae TaxID=2250578 RepID=A0A367EB34_9ACTN|nr:PQQ-binding-like beta-propeller repeat protein [Streptomyces reniochalinae]RCG15278.1 hypothetical protein DQ392_24095 [Streptomyces reniochalinae]